jgi:toxin ParE1/3/4
MAEVIVRPEAQADIRDAALWYDARRAGLGSEFTLQFDVLVERIAQNPLQFPEIGSGVRRALLQRFPYAIYFAVAAFPVVIAVLHQRRHPAMWKQRL